MGFSIMSNKGLTPLAYSIKEAAQVFSVSTPTIYAWIKQDRIRSVKIGGRTFIPATSLRALIGDVQAESAEAA
jgi:excisionase family DNA binding protein